MPSSDQEVFEKLTGDAETPDELASITYALFAHERREWIRHHEQHRGVQPTASDIQSWIGNLTDSQFAQMRTQAAGFFDAAARSYLADEIEARERMALQDAIVREVKTAGAFWRQFAIALLTSILAPIIIGGVIAAALVYNDRFPSIRDVSGVSNPPATDRPKTP